MTVNIQVYVVTAVDGYSAPRITVFSSESAAEEYASNMEADNWRTRITTELILSTVPVNQKHNIGFKVR